MSDLYSPEKYPDADVDWKPKKAGRPSSKTHPKTAKRVFELASLMMTSEEISAHLGLAHSTVRNNFKHQLRRGKLKACGSLRAKQYETAMKGNFQAQKWVGIQELGQKNRFDFDFGAEADPWAGSNFYDFAKPEEVESGSVQRKISDGEVIDVTYSKVELQKDGRQEGRSSETQDPQCAEEAGPDSQPDCSQSSVD